MLLCVQQITGVCWSGLVCTISDTSDYVWAASLSSFWTAFTATDNSEKEAGIAGHRSPKENVKLPFKNELKVSIVLLYEQIVLNSIVISIFKTSVIVEIESSFCFIWPLL